MVSENNAKLSTFLTEKKNTDLKLENIIVYLGGLKKKKTCILKLYSAARYKN